MNKITLSWLFFSVFLLTGCQTYTKENAKIRQEMYSGKITDALNSIDKSSIATEDRNYALFRMEKGMLTYLSKNYSQSETLWRQADQKLDDLYTVSISRTAESFIINDPMSDYNGEAHERVLLPIFTSLAYFADGNADNALVMVRRTYDIITMLQNENQGKNAFKYDAFSHYFSAMVYETKLDWDNAIVEYRAAFKNLQSQQQNTGGSSEFLDAKNEILKALGRLAEFRKRKDVLDQIKRENPKLTWVNQSEYLNKAEVYIIYECGKSPIKEPEDIVIPTGSNTIEKISFPKYVKLNYFSKYANVSLNGQLMGKTVVMENIGAMAIQSLSDRKIRDMAKLIARVAAKDMAAKKLHDENPYAGLAVNLFNIVTEVADTRSWTTLPDTVQIFRLLVEPNQNSEISILPQYGVSQKVSVNPHPGEKVLFRFRTFD